MKLTFNNNKIKFVNFNQNFKNCIKTKHWFLIMTVIMIVYIFKYCG